MKKTWFLLILPLAAPAAMAAVMLPHGVGIAPDSAAYFSVAHHIAAGKGVSAYYSLYSDQSHPMAAWPPLYPAVLAAGMAVTHAPETTTAWVLNLILLGLNLWLAGMIVSRATRSAFTGVAGQMMLVLTPEWRSYFTWALSEPLFLLMVNSGLLCCWKYIDSSRVRWFTAAALLAGFSGLVRYIGGVYLVALGLGLALLSRGSARERLRHAANFSILGAVPLAVWSLRNNLRSHETELTATTWVGRLFGSLMHYSAHQNGWAANFRFGIDACVAWAKDFAGPAMPGSWASWLAAVSVMLVTVRAAWVVRLRLRGDASSPAGTVTLLLTLCAFIYFVGLAASLTFLRYDVETPLRYEISTFTHMILAVLIMLTAVKAPDNGKPRGKTPRTVVLVLIAVWAVIGAPNTYASLSGIFHKGADGTSGDRLTQLSRIEWFPTEATVAEFRSRRLLEDQEKGKSF